jgi:type II restriction enzyme
MNNFLDSGLASKYNSSSQKIRVMSEDWVKNEICCPKCLEKLIKVKNNTPVMDFVCSNCNEKYELKAKKDNFGNKIVDGEYSKMIDRISSRNNTNFFFLNYNGCNYEVVNFFAIPKRFFIPSIIEKRKPLAVTAKRAGWTGCNILTSSLPESGKIYYIREKQVFNIKSVKASWEKVSFLEAKKDILSTSWIVDVMKCIDKIDSKEFTLKDIYMFENELKIKYPKNNHIKDKIRQQLQFLRDKGYLEFKSKGKYKILS